jgi:DNA topoisomerase-2
LGKTPIQLWNEDLDTFLKGYEEHLEEWSRTRKGTTGKGGKKKQATLRTRKSIGKHDDADDDDFEFKPAKTAAAKASKPARAKPTVAVPSKSTVALRDDEDSDAVVAPPPKKVAGHKTKPAHDDSDSDLEIVPRKDKGKGKAPPKRKR